MTALTLDIIDIKSLDSTTVAQTFKGLFILEKMKSWNYTNVCLMLLIAGTTLVTFYSYRTELSEVVLQLQPDTTRGRRHFPAYQTFTKLTMNERRQLVKQRCYEWQALTKNSPKLDQSKWDQSKWDQLKLDQHNAFVLIDNTFRLLACETPKVGSSTIVNLLYKLNKMAGVIPQPIFRNKVLLHELPPEVINAFPYEAFMFARDPLDRLFSAYKDHRGLLHRNGSLMSFGRFLTDMAARKNYTLTNIHYMSYYDRCRPCEVNYQYFGEMKTYSADLDLILRKVNITLPKIPQRNKAHGKVTKVNPTNVINKLPLKVKKALWQRYREDYFIFGYPKPFHDRDD